MPAPSIRARVRAEMLQEIKTIARRHLETDGANLSLRAVARDMGMVSSALYRYYASRDDLLTALIIDAYNEVGAAAEAADAGVEVRTDLRGRFLAIGAGVRRWALAKPAEYALIYGSPVPGYQAPQDTIGAAARTILVIVSVFADGHAAGALTGTTADLSVALRADLTAACAAVAPGLPEEVLMRGSVAWIHLFGAVSFELFGQLNNVIEARSDYFDAQMGLMADLAGLP
jgi:AcrR family transcriptional regulator